MVAGQGGVGPEPGAARPPHHRQLAVARRRLRHLPARRRLFSLLARCRRRIGEIDALDGFETDQEALAFYVDAVTFLVAAVHDLAARSCPSTRSARRTSDRRIDFGQAFRELKEGWSFIFINPVVRAVNVGLATGLIGGGMLVPLGPVFSDGGARRRRRRLRRPDHRARLRRRRRRRGAVGVPAPHPQGPGLRRGRSSARGSRSSSPRRCPSLGLASLFVGVLGVCAGSVYVLGFTLLHENVDDELRGRIFSALYTLVRFCVLLAFAVGPFLSGLLDQLSDLFARRDHGRRRVDRRAGRAPHAVARRADHRRRRRPRHRVAALRRRGRARRRAPTSALDELLLQEGAELVSGMTGPFTEVRRSHEQDERATAGRAARRARPERGRRRVSGHFIAFEGGEGSGKSTQARRLAERLGPQALLTFEPGDSPLGAEVRRLVLDSPDLDITDRAEALLMAADRAQHVAEVIEPALDAGRTVICDRFAGSSIAYQGHGRQLPAARSSSCRAGRPRAAGPTSWCCSR